LLNSDFHFFVAQNLELLPIRGLSKIFPQIREKSRTILVIHEGYKKCLTAKKYQDCCWDAIVCFDERYKTEFSQLFPAEKIHLIPYPAHPLSFGDKKEARRNLELPLEKKIILTYGITFQQHLAVLPEIAKLTRFFPIIYLLLAHETPVKVLNKVKKKYDFVTIREGAYSIDELYGYLHAADVLLLHKGAPGGLAVSSSIYLCLGSGCPIAIYAGRYTEDLGEEVFKYRNLNELESLLIRIFEGVKPNLKAADKFLTERGSPEVASSFCRLFTNLSRENERKTKKAR